MNKIATYKFELPSDRPAQCPIKVTYSYDVNQRMHCKFQDLKSGKVLEVDFCLDQNGKMSQSEIRKKTHQLEPFKVK